MCAVGSKNSRSCHHCHCSIQYDSWLPMCLPPLSQPVRISQALNHFAIVPVDVCSICNVWSEKSIAHMMRSSVSIFPLIHSFIVCIGDASLDDAVVGCVAIAVIASEAIATNGTENRESMTWSDCIANSMLENERRQLSAVARAHSENSFVHNKKYEKSLN